MDFDAALRSSGLDRYDRNARIYPALLCLLPVFAVIAIWFPPVWTMLGGLISLVVAFGTLYYSGQIVRYLGRRQEERLGVRVGRLHTAALLSHGNTEIPKGSKARYHDYLRSFGRTIPDEASEKASPQEAHDAYRSAVDWLLVHTRKNAKASMLLNENIAYGFRRNMLGVKPVGIVFSVIALICDGVLTYRGADSTRVTAGLVVGLLIAAALVAWVLVVRASFVEDASTSYAKRFLEQCERTGRPGKPKAS